MLNQIHSIAKGFGAKLLLALLVLSFAVWGIGDMINAPASNQTVAKVGKSTITEGALRHRVAQEAEKIRNAMGENYSPEMLKNLQIPQQILKMMVGQLLMQQAVVDLGISVPDEGVAKLIQKNPAFHDEKGKFSKDVLRQQLARTGLTEKAFLDQVRQQEAGRMVLESLGMETAVHEAAVKNLYLSRHQKRDVNIYVINASAITDVKQPTKEEVETFYKENTGLFMVPEYRTLSYLTFTGENVKNDVSVSEDDIQAAYEEHHAEFRHEEKRVVEQLLYSSEDKANEAAQMAKDGKSFAEIAEATGAVNKKNLSLGSVTQKSMFDGAGEKVFALPEKGVSDVVQSPFGWHVFRVASIEPESVDPIEKVRDRLKKDVLAQKQEDAVGKFANSLEDAFAAGSSLQDVAKEHGLHVVTLPAINYQGKTVDGTEVSLPKLDKFLQIASKLDEKTESSVTFSKGGTYFVVRADKIEPEHARPLEEVMPRATELATLAARQMKLTSMIGDISDQFADKTKRSGIISQMNLVAKQADGVKRTDKKIAGIALPDTLVAEMFVRATGDATAAYGLNDGSFAIAVVNNITPASLPSDDSQLSSLRKELEGSFTNEIMDEYMNDLAAHYSVEIMPGKVSSLQVD